MVIRKNKYTILILLFFISSQVFSFNYKKELLENNPVYKKAMATVNSCYAKAGVFRTENLPQVFLSFSPNYQAKEKFEINHLIFTNKIGISYSLNNIANFSFSATNLIPFNVYYNQPENQFNPNFDSSFSFPLLFFSQNILQAKKLYSSYDLQKKYAFLFELLQTRKVLLETVDSICSFFIYTEKEKVFSELITLYKQKAKDDFSLFEKGRLSLEEVTENNQTLNNYEDADLKNKIELNYLKEKLLTFGFSTDNFPFLIDSFFDFWFSEAAKLSLSSDTNLELEEISEKLNIASTTDDYLGTVPTVSTSATYTPKTNSFSTSLVFSIPFVLTENFYYYDKIIKCSLEEAEFNAQERTIKRKNLATSRATKEKLFQQNLDSKEAALELEKMKTLKVEALLFTGQLNEFDLNFQKINQKLAQIEVYIAKKQIITSFLQNF